MEGVFEEKLPVVIFDDFTTASKFVDFPFKAKSSAMKILLAKNSINIKFIYESMQLIGYEVGVHERHWISIFSKLKIPVPNIKEQQKIASCLSSLDDLIAAQTEKLDGLKDHKKGLLQQLFPAEGETVPKLRFPEFVNDGEWEEDKLLNLITNVSPPKKLKSSQYESKGAFPIIDQSQNRVAGWTNNENSLINGNFPLIVFGDHTCILKIVEYPFVQGADGIKIFEGKKIIDTRYLYYALQHQPLLMKQYERHFSILKEKLINYPDYDSGEQQKIASCLSSIDDLIETQTEKIETLKDHKKGLMQSLFPTVNKFVA